MKRKGNVKIEVMIHWMIFDDDFLTSIMSPQHSLAINCSQMAFYMDQYFSATSAALKAFTYLRMFRKSLREYMPVWRYRTSLYII